MVTNSIGSQFYVPNLNQNSGNGVTNNNLSFGGLLDTVGSIENNQLQTRSNIYNMLKTGQGDSTQALIAQQEAVTQIQDASAIRDKFLDSYRTIMNMQI